MKAILLEYIVHVNIVTDSPFKNITWVLVVLSDIVSMATLLLLYSEGFC